VENPDPAIAALKAGQLIVSVNETPLLIVIVMVCDLDCFVGELLSVTVTVAV